MHAEAEGMKITQSDIALASRQERTDTQQVSERLRFWRGAEGQGGSAAVRSESGTSPRPSVLLALSDVARQARPLEVPGRAVGRPSHQPVQAEKTREVKSDDKDAVEPRLQVLARMVEAMTGIKVRVFHAEELHGEVAAVEVSDASSNATAAASAQRAGWGMTYDRVEIRYEQEISVFAAQGTVSLADRRSISFEMGLVMQREQLEVSQVQVRAGDAAVMKDPLVLHFDGAAPALTDTRFAFDLDADGTNENMPFVGVSSGFLVFDRNANGRADDGTELFGATTGNGFAELAAHDDDGNGWIDESDDIYAQLLVWQKDLQGQDSLRTLQEANVGALYLGQVASPFSVKGEGNATLGQVRASGVYLAETGETGVMQQIDLSV